MKKGLILFFVSLMILSSFIYAQEACPAEDDIDIVVFYGQGCPHCADEESFLEDLEEKYHKLHITKYEVYSNQTNRELFKKFSDAFGTEIKGVPTTFIDRKVFIGFTAKTGESIEKEVKKCIEEGCTSALDIVDGNISVVEDDKSPSGIFDINQLTLPAVIGAAAVDAINPCAFAVLIILLATILASKEKKKVLWAGLAFTASIYISYFLMGLGLFSVIRVSGLTSLFYTVVAVLAILIGLFNLKDYLWYGKWFTMEVPQSWRPKLKMLLKGITSVPGAFLIGFVISLFLLPCTSGPYIVILGLLAKSATKNYALALLLLYNFIFILPMLLITGAIYFGFTTTEQAEEWRSKKLKVLHLIAGAVILLLGIIMLVALWLGYV
jgi:cytochrome c biogenesis protein CcdA/glutaredoxin